MKLQGVVAKWMIRFETRSRWGRIGLLVIAVAALVIEYHGVGSASPRRLESPVRLEGVGGRAKSAAPQFTAATVQHIVDGDTLVLLIEGRREQARLIGIDGPESRANERAQRTAQREGMSVNEILAMGKRSTAHLRSLVASGAEVMVEFDLERRDRYQRLLVYLRLASPDPVTLNERMVKEGFAYPYTVPPNVRYADRIARSFKEARSARRGLWGD